MNPTDSGIITGANLLLRKLADFFPASEIKWKPQAVKGNRALALAYINTRAIMDRLDDVIGPDGWEDRYTPIGDGNVMCLLRVRIGERWVKKSDVGGPSEQPDSGDRVKAAFSDAFKRAAVKFGIGRYLARMPQQWADYDPQKRAFVSPPRVPDAFLPKSAPSSQLRGSQTTARNTARPVIAGVERVSEFEAANLSERLKAAQFNPESVLKHFDINRLEDLPAKELADILAKCEQKISGKAAKPAGQAA